MPTLHGVKRTGNEAGRCGSGGGHFVVKEGGAEELECVIRDVATVWDGEVEVWQKALPGPTREKSHDLSRLEGSYRGC